MSETLAEQLLGVTARQVGHTTAVVKGVANTPGAMVITGTEQEARRLRLDYGVEAIPLSGAEQRLRGRAGAFVLDSYAINFLAAEARELSDRIAELTAALDTYGVHHEECKARLFPFHNCECSCGLAAAKKKAAPNG